jgi:hypothetical protein
MIVSAVGAAHSLARDNVLIPRRSLTHRLEPAFTALKNLPTCSLLVNVPDRLSSCRVARSQSLPIRSSLMPKYVRLTNGSPR